MIFANPEYFYIALVLVPMIVWYIFKNRTASAGIKLSSIKGFQQTKTSYKVIMRHSLFVLRCLAILSLVVAIARPQSDDSWDEKSTEGIDIMLALDISSSMLAQDFQPNRIEAAKDIAVRFISGREEDRIGLAIFAAESFTQCPLTDDHATLINLFQEIESGILEDGTAIGMGLSTAVNRLKESKAKSKVIILLTDGENNRGAIDPLTAAEIAKTFGIRVYTIGVGTIGQAPYPFQTPFGIQLQPVEVKIDEPTLKQISEITDGAYFRATDNNKLIEVYKEIDKLEKTKIDVKHFSKVDERYLPFALLAGIILLLEILLRHTIFRRIP
ncbi:MAG: VWA domain-containing protein [Bacteroidales bacterium]|nr:VWA domain-containing protein [Bacteroidales bacterium]